MKASRVTAVGLVVAAALWIASGELLPRDSAEGQAAIRPAQAKSRSSVPRRRLSRRRRRAQPQTDPVRPHRGRPEGQHQRAHRRCPHRTARSPRLSASRKATSSPSCRMKRARRRCARRSHVEQRKTELDAKRMLIEQGNMPKLELVNLEAQYKSAQATLAAAEAERDRGIVRAPWDGVVTDVPVEVGRAAFSFTGTRALRRWSRSIRCWRWSKSPSASSAASRSANARKSGWSPARPCTGHVRFVSKSASPTTRTYRVEVEMANPDGKIPDGITAEVTFRSRRCRQYSFHARR